MISPRQNSYKVAGAGGMEEGLNVPETTLKCLELHASADAQNLLDLDLAAKHRNTGFKVKKKMHAKHLGKITHTSILEGARYLSCSRAVTSRNSELLGGTVSMLHLRARYFPGQEGTGLLRFISLTFRTSLINLTTRNAHVHVGTVTLK